MRERRKGKEREKERAEGLFGDGNGRIRRLSDSVRIHEGGKESE